MEGSDYQDFWPQKLRPAECPLHQAQGIRLLKNPGLDKGQRLYHPSDGESHASYAWLTIHFDQLEVIPVQPFQVLFNPLIIAWSREHGAGSVEQGAAGRAGFKGAP